MAIEACANGCGKPASACHRASWPTVPKPPPRGSVREEDEDEYYRLRDEEKARRLASARVPVCQARRTCAACSGQPSCSGCKAWECAACAADAATPAAFAAEHEEDPDVYEDDYGRREPPLYCALDMRPCATCRRPACARCRISCSGCAGAVCRHCRLRSTSCKSCQRTIDNEDEYDIGPVNRDEGLCDACWAAGMAEGGVFCGCGEPAREARRRR